ncbi:MAG: KEOPS complex subunit Pcc1 [Nitrososphaerales archaeon]
MSVRKSASPAVPRLVEASAAIEFTSDSEVCRAVSEALKPEVLRSSERFVKTKVEVDGGSLKLNLSATDLANLRAGVNSYFNLVKASSETLSTQL